MLRHFGMGHLGHHVGRDRLPMSPGWGGHSVF